MEGAFVVLLMIVVILMILFSIILMGLIGWYLYKMIKKE